MRITELRGNTGTMKTGLLLTMTLVAAGSLPTSLAQSQSSQPIDPTAQSPSTLAPTPSLAVPLEVKQSEDGVSHSETMATGSSNQKTGTSFVGKIVKRQHAYVLKAADAEYLLNNSVEAKKYKGKRVKVTGNSNASHVIRVEMIELSPPL